MNGPLLQQIEILSLKSIATTYSKPLMVGKDGVNKKGTLTSFRTIHFTEENTFGHGLILDNHTKVKNWGFIADAQNNPGLSKILQTEILEHAKHFSNKEYCINVKPSTEMFFATISDKKNTTIHIESTAVIKNIRGYAGEINVGVFIDKNGFINSVKHIASKETQSYLADIKSAGFYDQFKTVSITNGTQQIDAISGATLTSQAIASTVFELIKVGTPYPISNYAEINEVTSFSVAALLSST